MLGKEDVIITRGGGWLGSKLRVRIERTRALSMTIMSLACWCATNRVWNKLMKRWVAQSRPMWNKCDETLSSFFRFGRRTVLRRKLLGSSPGILLQCSYKNTIFEFWNFAILSVTFEKFFRISQHHLFRFLVSFTLCGIWPSYSFSSLSFSLFSYFRI